jgi:hypothetical protein
MDYLFYLHSQPPWPYRLKPFVFVKFNYTGLKGTVSRDFLLQVFFKNHLPQARENNIRVISNFAPSVVDSGGAPSLANISRIFVKKSKRP